MGSAPRWGDPIPASCSVRHCVLGRQTGSRVSSKEERRRLKASHRASSRARQPDREPRPPGLSVTSCSSFSSHTVRLLSSTVVAGETQPGSPEIKRTGSPVPHCHPTDPGEDGGRPSRVLSIPLGRVTGGLGGQALDGRGEPTATPASGAQGLFEEGEEGGGRLTQTGLCLDLRL